MCCDLQAENHIADFISSLGPSNLHVLILMQIQYHLLSILIHNDIDVTSCIAKLAFATRKETVNHGTH